MKYLVILTILAGSLYQFYFPKLNEESINEFVASIRLADTNNDYEAMNHQLTESVLVSKLDENLNVVTQKEITKKQLIKLVKILKRPKYNSLEKSEIEKIEIFDEKAVVTSLNTSWMTVDGQRIKKVSKEVLTIIVQDVSFKVNELGSYLISTEY
jgi:hypothetical protein